MKRILIGITILGVGGALVFNVIQGNTEDYVAGTATSTPEVLLPEWASDTEAVEAAQAVMRKKALTESINVLDGEIEALTATYDARLNELIEEKTTKEKELGSY